MAVGAAAVSMTRAHSVVSRPNAVPLPPAPTPPCSTAEAMSAARGSALPAMLRTASHVSFAGNQYGVGTLLCAHVQGPSVANMVVEYLCCTVDSPTAVAVYRAQRGVWRLVYTLLGRVVYGVTIKDGTIYGNTPVYSRTEPLCCWSHERVNQTRWDGNHFITTLGPTISVSRGGTQIDRFTVDPNGLVGSLALDGSRKADVERVEGPPQVSVTGNVSPARFPNYLALGYGCTSKVITSCETIFFINTTTKLLTSFATIDARYHTVGGTHPGSSQAAADIGEEADASAGCHPGIHETTPGATLILHNRGGRLRRGSTVGGIVSYLSVEVNQGSVGYQSC
jgi:hypothetical protein